MQTRLLGRTNLQITPLILGTWQAGKRWWVGIDDQESIRAIRAAVEAGMTTIDTAEVYGDGHSEQIVAAAVGDLRDRCVYATKVFANHLRYPEVIAACERSLRNLNTDYIDLYQIHWPSGSFGTEVVPISETMQAMVELQQAGKIRAIGVSNFSRAQLLEAMQYGRIDSVQPPYSLFWRWAETELVPFCIEHDITILAYSALAQGLLTGRFGAEHRFAPEDNRAKNQLFQGETYARALEAIELMKPIAASLGTTVGNLALAWLLHQPQTCAIVGARHPEQVLENLKAAELSLDPSILEMLDDLSQPVIATLDPSNPVMWKW
ncbi:aldo/keto reductase [Synechococcus sp. PCC 6717]|jgi:aryl-alcohol dehydrogenase-like predicted oxidoreductase|uniref:Aldo/keto reductase n=1 Tax=Parathermosynechococcus lividus PCC 6715 TaxID=1917166 RepID=A0A2D2Q540_PARLV|nr:aldo/keto reductase [Thermostichus lividus]ATS19638.1 aldo/keto reductase [Thermostichus lividus PCC 6715]MCI3279941.1 aldo/keto reductase [Synechococcus sp. PCC 6717]